MSRAIKAYSFWYDVYANPTVSFHFTVKEQYDGSMRIYIDKQPSYPYSRKTDGHSTHRYGLKSGRAHICYEPPPRNLRDARNIAESWAKHTVKYMKSGVW